MRIMTHTNLKVSDVPKIFWKSYLENMNYSHYFIMNGDTLAKLVIEDYRYYLVLIEMKIQDILKLFVNRRIKICLRYIFIMLGDSSKNS